ncbi:MAG: hypothetical protein EOO88_29140 [Pedobacter sp.]|nr:MAG: hypothetical protein EOO88_29140 [Pedobacter sp.]
MENFNKNSLKAAVAKYGPLHSDGKTDAEVKAELAKDERGFTAEQIDEIYAAIVTPEVEDPKQEQPQGSETPDWVQTLLDSNAAVLESNQQVVEALEDLKSFADERSTSQSNSGELKVEVQLIDEDEDYEVAPGKSFRDPLDFTKEYTEGDDVTHLGVIKLQSLLNSGLIVES